MIDARKTGANALLFRVLSDEQCGELYEATLQCLERVGVQARQPEAQRQIAAILLEIAVQ